MYTTIISHAVLYGYKSCSLTLMEELRLSVFRDQVAKENMWAEEG
jgi:hypothetical protein